MKIIVTIAALGIFFLLESCNQNRQNSENGIKRNNLENSAEKSKREIFSRGEKLPKELITGNAWHNKLVNENSIYTTAVCVEKFEPGSRNVWHSHPAGQIIVVLDGVGYHQIKGQPAQILKKGDVAQCPPWCFTLAWCFNKLHTCIGRIRNYCSIGRRSRDSYRF